MIIPRRTASRALFSLAAWVVLALSTTIQADEWEWTAVPYLWGAAANLDIEVNDDPVFGGDLAFSDLLDKLEIAGMLHFEGRSGRTGFFVDAAYLSLADATTTSPNPPLFPDGAAVDSEVEMGRYEAAGFYRLKGQAAGFDLFLGIRAIDLDEQVGITRSTPTPAATSESLADTLLDGFLGARFGMPFAKRFWFHVRGDVGTGDTEMSFTANAGVGMWLGKSRKYGLDLAYEHFEFEVESGGDVVTVKSEFQLSGPIAGFVLRF